MYSGRVPIITLRLERAVTDQETTALGYQWASSLLAFVALAMAPFRMYCNERPAQYRGTAVLITIAAILFFKYGKRLRGNSRFAQGS